MLVNIFASSDDKTDIQKMTNEIISNNIIGIHGGRLHVSKIMREVIDLIEKYNEEIIFDDEKIEISCPSAYDHPDTDLGYLFNCKKYSFDIAEKAVIRAYDTKNSDDFCASLDKHHWTPLLKKCGLMHRRMYEMRHACATNLLMSGKYSVNEIASVLGHTTPQMLFQRYTRNISAERKPFDMSVDIYKLNEMVP